MALFFSPVFCSHTPARSVLDFESFAGRGHFIPKTPLPGQRRRSVSDAVLAAECFFTTHTPCRQSWRGHRIAPLNPGAGTGLPHSILAWAQDCPGVSQKTLEAQCCTALRPQTRRPDCAENTGSASVHTDALPDSPPGKGNGEDQAVSYDRMQQQTVLGPRGATGSVHGPFFGAVKIEQNRGSDQPDSGAVSRRL